MQAELPVVKGSPFQAQAYQPIHDKAQQEDEEDELKFH